MPYVVLQAKYFLWCLVCIASLLSIIIILLELNTQQVAALTVLMFSPRP